MPSIEVKANLSIVVVVGIIQHPITKKILISKRTENQHLAGLWEFPGGKVKRNEDLFHALERELDEEVGITIQSAYPLKKINHSYSDKLVCLHFWFVNHFNRDAEAKEGQDLEWVDLCDLKKYEFPEANLAIIKSLKLPSFWMITSDCHTKTMDDFLQSVEKSIIQFKLKQILFRSKNLKDKDYFLVYEKLKLIGEQYDCHIIINRDKLNDKISKYWHLTSTQLHQFKNRPLKQGFLSASCHTLDDIRQAEKLGVDFILLSAVRNTTSHPEAVTLGWYQFKQLAEYTTLPVYALGGVSRDDLSVARYHGAIGIAGISTFTNT